MEPYIAFEHITQTHLDILLEYHRKNVSVAQCARNCRMPLPDFKRELTIALALAGDISYFEPKGKARKKLTHFFTRWNSEGHRPKATHEAQPPQEPQPRIRPCKLPAFGDPALTPRQMECLRQFVTQPTVWRAAEAMRLTKTKFQRELHAGLYHAARLLLPEKALSVRALPKLEQTRLIYRYFEREKLMDDPMF